MREASFAVLLTSWFWHDSELWCGVQLSTLFTWPSTNQLISIFWCGIEFQVKFHNVENLKKKVTCELNILPVDMWWLFHAISRKKYVAVKGDYLEEK
jgi:hypothetical protein